MILSLVGTLRWTLSLGVKFAKVVPFSTSFIIGLTLVSQISMLVASLLPLKVVILLGSERIPSYFPDALVVYGHNVLIGLLSLVAIAFFLMHLLAERLITWWTEKATSHLLRMSNKMSLFENQEQVAKNAYSRFSRALASAVFVFLAFAGLGFFYPAMVLVQLSYVFLAVLLLWLLQHSNKSFQERLETQPGPILNLLSAIGFFVTFAFLIIDFIFLEPPVVLVAIISLLLARQVMNRLAGVAVDFFLLQRERIKLDALFFHGKVFMPQLAGSDKGIWALLSENTRKEWVHSVIDEFELNPDNEDIICSWQQVGVPNVGALQVAVGTKNYLLKLYETNRTGLAQHELALLSEDLSVLPGLRLVGYTQVAKHSCLVYHLPEGSKPELLAHKSVLWCFRTDLLATSVPASLVSHYQRSKPLLWQRLRALPLERFQISADSEEQKRTLQHFVKCLPDICQILSSLPLSVVNPDVGVDVLWVLPDERCLSLQWGQWSIEPVGAGWPENDSDLVKLNEVLPDVLKQRSDLANVPVAHIELASLAYALEREFNRQRFTQVMALLPKILERVEVTEDGA